MLDDCSVSCVPMMFKLPIRSLRPSIFASYVIVGFAVFASSFASSTAATSPKDSAPLDSAIARCATGNGDLVSIRNRLMSRVDEDRGYVEIMLDLALSWMQQTGGGGDGRITRVLGLLRACDDSKAIAELIGLGRDVEGTDKTKASSLWQTAALLVALNDPAKSADLFRHALDLTPEDADARYGLALAQAASGQVTEAMENIQKVVAATGKEANLFYQYWARLRLVRLEIRDDDIGGLLDDFDALKAKVETIAATKPSYLSWERDLAVALEDFGSAQFRMRDFDAALETYRSALTIEEKLLASQPDDAQWQSDIVHTERVTAVALFQTGDHAGALATLQDGMAVIRRSSVKLQNVPEWRSDRGTMSEYIALLLIRERHYREAQRFLLDAIGDAEWLGREAQDREDWPYALARREDLLADLLQNRLQDAPSAIVWYGKLCSIRSWLKRDRPNDRSRGFDLALAYRKLAAAHVAAGHGPEALDAYGNAMQVDSKLVEEDAKDVRGQSDLATTLDAVGEMQRDLGNEEAAVRAYARAQSLRHPLATVQDSASRQTAVH